MLIDLIVESVLKLDDLEVAKMYKSLIESTRGIESKCNRIRFFSVEADFDKFLKSTAKQGAEVKVWSTETHRVLVQTIKGKEYLYSCLKDSRRGENSCPYSSVFVGLDMEEKSFRHPSMTVFPFELGENMKFYVHSSSPKCLRLGILGDNSWDSQDLEYFNDSTVEKTREFL